MPRYPAATFRRIAGHTDGPMTAHLGIVLHVNESNGNLYNWVAGPNGMSCHFEVYKSGAVEQFLDTSFSSWCQKDGNATYLSVETEGYATEALSEAQVHALAKLLMWTHSKHGIPLRLAEKPGQPGFGWHGMGGDAWGHPNCPGTIRKAQRARIIALAQPTTGPGRAVVKVRAGDTLTSIAGSHKLSLAALVKLNPQIHDPDTIAIGQTVYVS